MALPPAGDDRAAIITGAVSGIGAEFILVNNAGLSPELLLPVLTRNHPALKRDRQRT